MSIRWLVIFFLGLALFGGLARAPEETSLSKLSRKRNIRMGTAVVSNFLAMPDVEYRQVLKREYSLLVAEKDMKFSVLQPAPGVYDFSKADALVAFARDHGMKVRGHTLVWHRSLPPWLEKGKFTPAELSRILQEHITTVMTHFREKFPGVVIAWDVVNEAATSDFAGPWASIGKSKEEFVSLAFQWARKADPDAKLFYNDHGAELPGIREEKIHRLVSKLKAQGVPVDGMGFQAHLDLDAPKKETLIAAFRKFADLGLEIHVTELEVGIFTRDTGTTIGLDRGVIPLDPREFEAQADIYKNILEACLAVSECKAFVTWGFTDRFSWLPRFVAYSGLPLPFDRYYGKKPAYFALMEALSAPTR